MVAIVAALIIAVILAYPKIFKKDKLEFFRSTGQVSVAVMPFQNITNDNSKNFWQELIQNKLITSLSNSEELKVRQTESIITLLRNNDVTNYASITPSIATYKKCLVFTPGLRQVLTNMNRFGVKNDLYF